MRGSTALAILDATVEPNPALDLRLMRVTDGRNVHKVGNLRACLDLTRSAIRAKRDELEKLLTTADRYESDLDAIARRVCR